MTSIAKDKRTHAEDHQKLGLVNSACLLPCTSGCPSHTNALLPRCPDSVAYSHRPTEQFELNYLQCCLTQRPVPTGPRTRIERFDRTKVPFAEEFACQEAINRSEILAFGYFDDEILIVSITTASWPLCSLVWLKVRM